MAYLVSGGKLAAELGEDDLYVLEAFFLCCSMCWGRHALKM